LQGAKENSTDSKTGLQRNCKQNTKEKKGIDMKTTMLGLIIHGRSTLLEREGREKGLRKLPQQNAFSIRHLCGKFLVKPKEGKTTVQEIPGCNKQYRNHWSTKLHRNNFHS
jgi:hypothetical protein